jgi:hypothetical protein
MSGGKVNGQQEHKRHTTANTDTSPHTQGGISTPFQDSRVGKQPEGQEQKRTTSSLLQNKTRTTSQVTQTPLKPLLQLWVP